MTDDTCATCGESRRLRDESGVRVPCPTCGQPRPLSSVPFDTDPTMTDTTDGTTCDLRWGEIERRAGRLSSAIGHHDSATALEHAAHLTTLLYESAADLYESTNTASPGPDAVLANILDDLIGGDAADTTREQRPMTEPHERQYNGATCPVCGDGYDQYRKHYQRDDEYRTRSDATACRRQFSNHGFEVWVHLPHRNQTQ